MGIIVPHRTRAFRETALVYDLFDYKQTKTVDPYNTHVFIVRVNGAGDATYNGLYTNIGYVGPDSTVVFHLPELAGDRYLFYNESEWRLGLNYDPPDEDFAYGSDMTDDIWGDWYPNTAVGAPRIFVDSTEGGRGGFGWGSNGWSVETSCFDFGVKAEQLLYTKNSIDLRSGNHHLFSKLSVATWPDVEIKRTLDYKYMPSRLLTSNKLGANGTTLWMAYVVEPVGSIPASRWFGVKHDASYGWFGRNYNSSYWGMEIKLGGGQQNSTTAITADVTHLIVQKQVWAGDGSKVVGSLWVDPTPAVHPAQSGPDETPDIDSADMTAWTFNTIWIAFSQVAKFAAYRLGESYFSVAPGQRGLES